MGLETSHCLYVILYLGSQTMQDVSITYCILFPLNTLLISKGSQ